MVENDSLSKRTAKVLHATTKWLYANSNKNSNNRLHLLDRSLEKSYLVAAEFSQPLKSVIMVSQLGENAQKDCKT